MITRARNVVLINNPQESDIGDFYKMISRIWHGWTTPDKADIYESLLKSEIFHGIRDKEIAGYKGIHLLRRDHSNEVEFITIMWFDDLNAVRSFAGEDYEACVVPKKARAVLSRFDERSQHYEVKEHMTTNDGHVF